MDVVLHGRKKQIRKRKKEEKSVIEIITVNVKRPKFQYYWLLSLSAERRNNENDLKFVFQLYKEFLRVVFWNEFLKLPSKEVFFLIPCFLITGKYKVQFELNTELALIPMNSGSKKVPCMEKKTTICFDIGKRQNLSYLFEINALVVLSIWRLFSGAD